MTSDKAVRDRANNQKFQDIYVHASQEPWLPFFPGIDFKVLRATQVTREDNLPAIAIRRGRST